MDPALIQALDAGDLDAAAEWIDREDDPARVLALHHGAMRHLYWQRRDLPGVVRLGSRAIEAGRRAADASAPGEGADRIRGSIKTIAYDLSSFTWPGWDEEGIEITPDDLATGTQAARLNLELALDLGRGDDVMSAAHWLVGAHALASGHHDDAREAFVASALAAGRADETGAELMARGYAAVVDVVEGLPGADRALDLVIAELAGVDDGTEYLAQIDTALAVFS